VDPFQVRKSGLAETELEDISIQLKPCLKKLLYHLAPLCGLTESIVYDGTILLTLGTYKIIIVHTKEPSIISGPGVAI
jgi:hypothetical protein